MAQNIYDDPDFFAGYSGLPRSVHGLDGAAEWPVLRSLLPAMAGDDVVDLGCGFGWFCRWAAGAGARNVLGIDLSQNMLDRARADTDDARITYEQQDLDELELQDGRFDLAYSSLTLHYLADLDRLFGTVHRALRPQGGFVFSIEHPVYSAPSNPAFVAGADGRPIWPLDGYLREGPRTTNWLAPGVIKQHRTITSYVSALLRNEFTLTDLVEWGPSPEQIAENPEWDVELDRPFFLLVGAHRN